MKQPRTTRTFLFPLVASLKLARCACVSLKWTTRPGHDDRLTLDGVHGRVALMLILFQRFFPFVAVRSRAVCVCSFVLTAVAETVVVVLIVVVAYC
uniref:Secreted protein n=1 Tax=Plectus sambesii TaxID=2011161 RepID=A0A914VE23_9BILA